MGDKEILDDLLKELRNPPSWGTDTWCLGLESKYSTRRMVDKTMEGIREAMNNAKRESDAEGDSRPRSG